MNELNPPIEQNAILEVPIVSFGKNGDPIVKIEKYVIFVKLNPGDKLTVNSCVKIQVTKVLPKFGFAILYKE